jgi:myo-inositol-1(or 4)-monophosphatase
MSDLRELLDVAQAAVTEAAGAFTSLAVGKVTAKGERDMVSNVDLAIEELVRAFLVTRVPDIAFIGEEQGTHGSGAAEFSWCLDPVDGTANYLREIPLCGISLGLYRGSRAVLGVIDLPMLGQRFHAVEGSGAFRNGDRIRPSKRTSLPDSIVALGDFAVGADDQALYVQQLRLMGQMAPVVQRVRMFGSSVIDLTAAASGQVDACVSLVNRPWDTAAGVAIAREAGARVLDLDGSEHTFASTGTIAVAPGISDQLLQLIQDGGRDA